MPITKGYTAKLATISVGSERVQVSIWPESIADQVAVVAAGGKAPTDKVEGAYRSAGFLHTLCRKSDGSAYFATIDVVLESMTVEQMESACSEVRAVLDRWAEELDLGNP